MTTIEKMDFLLKIFEEPITSKDEPLKKIGSLFGYISDEYHLFMLLHELGKTVYVEANRYKAEIDNNQEFRIKEEVLEYMSSLYKDIILSISEYHLCRFLTNENIDDKKDCELLMLLMAYIIQHSINTILCERLLNSKIVVEDEDEFEYFIDLLNSITCFYTLIKGIDVDLKNFDQKLEKPIREEFIFKIIQHANENKSH